MATSRLPDESQRYRFAAVVVAGLLIGTGAFVAFQPVDAQADVTLDELHTQNATVTTGENVTGVTLAADLNYSHSVPDADKTVLRLKAGPDADTLDVVTFRSIDNGDSGSVTMSGDVLERTALSAADFEPPVAGTVQREFVVAAQVVVMRPDGEDVTDTVTAPVTVTVHDDATLTASVGGTVSVTVETGQ